MASAHSLGPGWRAARGRAAWRNVRGLAALVGVALASSACVTFVRPRSDWATPVDLPLDPEVMRGAVIGLRCGEGEVGEAAYHRGRADGCTGAARLIVSLGAMVRAEAGVLPPPETSDDDEQKAATDEAAKSDTKSTDAAKTAENDAKEALVKGSVGPELPELGEDGAAAESTAPDAASTDAVKVANADKKAPTATPAPTPDFTLVYVERSGDRDFCWWTFPIVVFTASLFPCVDDSESHAELIVLDEHGLATQRHALELQSHSIYGIGALYYNGLDLLDPDAKPAREAQLADNLAQFIQNVVYTQRVRQLVAGQGAP